MIEKKEIIEITGLNNIKFIIFVQNILLIKELLEEKKLKKFILKIILISFYYLKQKSQLLNFELS